MRRNNTLLEGAGDLSYAFDLAFMPGSYLRLMNEKNYKSGLGKGLSYGYATLFEGLRLGMYYAFFTVAPIIPLSFMVIGLMSLLLNKQINKPKSLESMI